MRATFPELGTIPPARTDQVGPTTTVNDGTHIGPPQPGEVDVPDKPRACVMSSPEAVNSALGVAAASTLQVDSGGVLGCKFRDAAGITVATISIVTAEAGPEAVFAEQVAVDGAQLVDGVGDGAVWAGGALYVRAFGEVSVFTRLEPPADPADDAARDAAKAWALASLELYVKPGRSAPRACPMIFNSDLSTIVKIGPLFGNEQEEFGRLVCTFSDGDDTPVFVIVVVTTVADIPPADVYAQSAASDGAQLIDLRDGAVWANGSLVVKMQTEVVVFAWLAPTAPTDDDELRDATVAVATKALRGYLKP